ncbi:hypothetical protein JCM8547_004723 [Rhodosporidiobolus lusitaniae]
MATQTQTLPASTATTTGTLTARGTRTLPLEPTGILDQYKPKEVTPVIGTQFDSGVQLAELLEAENSDELFRELAITIHRRNVVFFKYQRAQLTNAQLKAIANKLGIQGGRPAESGLHIHPTERHEDNNEVSPITGISLGKGNTQARKILAGSRLARRGWHTDITFEPVPSDVALLNVWEVPESGGGDTLWASAYEAYDRLTPAFQRFVEGLTAVHDGNHFHASAKARGIPIYTSLRGHPLNDGPNLTATHPVVRTNPVTGWKGLFVNRVFTKRIVELNLDESQKVLEHLFEIVELNHDLQVRFKWDKNDVALWSNTSSLHNITLDYNGVRTGHRAVSLAEQPYFDPASKGRREALGLPAWLNE